jgi:hypothetical protein
VIPLLLAQAEAPLPPGMGGLEAWWWSVTPYLYGALVIWMAYVCVRDDPDARLWIWVILAFAPLGPFIYLIGRYLPTREYHGPAWLRRWTRGSEVRRKEIAAHNIGNAHQYIELGDIYRETGKWDQACTAFAEAVRKEPQNVAALWGAAQCEFRREDYTTARAHLETILKKDPAYKFGDVSLLQGRLLQKVGDEDAAIAHLRDHTRRWRHPESLFILAQLLAKRGENAEARKLLNGLLMDLEAAPRAIVRKQLFWRGRAKKLLKTLPM